MLDLISRLSANGPAPEVPQRAQFRSLRLATGAPESRHSIKRCRHLGGQKLYQRGAI